MPQWKPLGEVPELAGQVPPPLPQDPPPVPTPERTPKPPDLEAEVAGSRATSSSTGHVETPVRAASRPETAQVDQATPETTSSDETHAWRRFFARLVDYTLYSLALAIALALTLPFVAPDLFSTLFVEEGGDWAFAFLMMWTWIPIEGWLLSRWGTTPGKWMVSLRVLRKNGDHLSFGVGTKRALHVLIRGLGIGIPLIALITQLVAVNKLHKEGETTWDRDLELDVRAAELTAGRIVLLVAALALFAYLVYLGSMPAT